MSGYIDVDDATCTRFLCSFYLFMLMSEARAKLVNTVASCLAVVLLVEMSIISTEVTVFARGPPQQLRWLAMQTRRNGSPGSLFAFVARNACVALLAIVLALLLRIVLHMLREMVSSFVQEANKHEQAKPLPNDAGDKCGVLTMIFIMFAYYACTLVSDGLGESGGLSIAIACAILTMIVLVSYLESLAAAPSLQACKKYSFRIVPLGLTYFVALCCLLNASVRKKQRGFSSINVAESTIATITYILLAFSSLVMPLFLN